MTDQQPKEGDLRVWAMRDFDFSDKYSVATPKEAIELINQMAAIDLKSTTVTCNAFGLEVFEDGEWCEWHDAEGREISEYVVVDGVFRLPAEEVTILDDSELPGMWDKSDFVGGATDVEPGRLRPGDPELDRMLNIREVDRQSPD